MANPERKNIFVLFNMHRWPVIGPWIRRDRARFLQEQASGKQAKGPEQREAKIKEIRPE